jgi:hypothetical protein
LIREAQGLTIEVIIARSYHYPARLIGTSCSIESSGEILHGFADGALDHVGPGGLESGKPSLEKGGDPAGHPLLHEKGRRIS